MNRTLRALLSLTRHASAPGGLCMACHDQAIREELASLAHAADVEEIACGSNEGC